MQASRKPHTLDPWEAVALTFVNHLIKGNADQAHTLLAHPLQQSVALDELKKSFEQIASSERVPLGNPELVCSMHGWPDQKQAEKGVCYVHIGGDRDEAVIVTISEDQKEGKPLWEVSSIEWGRP